MRRRLIRGQSLSFSMRTFVALHHLGIAIPRAIAILRNLQKHWMLNNSLEVSQMSTGR